MKNRFFDNLGKRVSIGAVISMSDPTVCELAGDCGMDFCWIDAEHCPMTIETVIIKPYLDLAPDGIICPMVNTPELAEAAVAACRYPPLGIRGWGPRRGVGYGGFDTQAYIKESEHYPLVICQIEHIDAVRNLDKILQVPGVDSFAIGPMDLSGSMGLLTQTDHPELNKVIDEICMKVKKAGKILGTASSNFPRWKARGVDWFTGMGDWNALAAGFRAHKAECDKA